MVRGYHVYRDVWEAAVGQTLPCQREAGNPHDPYAVSVTEGGTIVGHVPRAISAVCSLFLRRNGTILCEVTGTRRKSSDLPQGGLEIPCKLIFAGTASDILKVRNLLQIAQSSGLKMTCMPEEGEDAEPEKLKSSKKAETPCKEGSGNEDPVQKQVKTETLSFKEKVPGQKRVDIDIDAHKNSSEEMWLQLDTNSLSQHERKELCDGKRLTDLHINYAQALLKKQFPTLEGLQSSLLQRKKPKSKISHGLQIIHSRSDHWIVASTFGGGSDVKVFDSVYTSVDKGTKTVIAKLFQSSERLKIAALQKQRGGDDCGLFAIAVATALSFGVDPSEVSFQQDAMRPHLVKCFEDGLMTLFPTTS